MDTLTLTRSFTSLLLDSAAKGTALLLLACLTAWMFRRSSAALRHSIWCMSMGGLLLLPVASWALPAWQIPILPPVPSPAATPVAEVVRLLPSSPTATELPSPPSPPPHITSIAEQAPQQLPTPPRLESNRLPPPPVATPETVPAAAPLAEPAPPLTALEWTSLLVSSLWSLGVTLFGILLLIGLQRTVQLRRTSQTISDGEWPGMLVELRQRLGLARSVELREHAQSVVPLTWGIWRPVVLVPQLAREWDEPMRRAVLLHELAHVQRGDVACQVLGRLTCVLYWFHPLAWFALRQLRQEREQACDDAVVQSGEKASDYAEQLLQVARLCCAPRGLSLGVAMAEGSSLERRVKSLFDSARSHGPLTRRVALALFAIGGAILAGLAPIEPTASHAEPDAKAPDLKGLSAKEQMELLKPKFGDAKRGIQLGVAFASPAATTYALGDRVPMVLFFRNAGRQEVTFQVHVDFMAYPPSVVNEDGQKQSISSLLTFIDKPTRTITLKPDEVYSVETYGLGLGKKQGAPSFESPVDGKYTIEFSEGIFWNLNDPQEKWSEGLTSGTLEFEVTSGLLGQQSVLIPHAASNLAAADTKAPFPTARQATVSIATEKPAPEKPGVIQWAGSGFIVNSDGYIVTAKHVVDGAQKIQVKLHDGTELPASVVGADPAADLAVLLIHTTQPLTAMPEQHQVKAQVGDKVTAIGNAWGHAETLSRGEVTGLGRDVELNETQKYTNLIQTDAANEPVYSGGPLLNAQGEAIGINIAIRAGVQKIGFAMPITEARKAYVMLMSRMISGPAAKEQLDLLKPVFGEAKRGIQLGLAVGSLERTFPQGGRIPLWLFYRNLGDKELTFQLSQDFTNYPVTVTDENGKRVQVNFAMHWMFDAPLTITLKPGEVWCIATPGLNLGDRMPSIRPVAGKYKLTYPQGIWDVNTTPQLRTDLPALPTTIPDTSLPNQESPRVEQPAANSPGFQIVETPNWSENLTTGTIEFEIATSQAGALEAHILASLPAADSHVAESPSQEPAPPNAATEGEVIEGIVLDAVTRQPVSGAMVDFGYFGPEKNTAITTDKGEFRIPGIDPLEMVIAVVTKGGYAQRLIESRGREFDRVILLDNQTYFEGTITDTNGKPVADATVRASWEAELSDGSVAPLSTETRSKADGTYRLHVESLMKNSGRQLEPTGYDIQGSAPGRGVARSSGHFIVRGNPVTLPLKLEPGVRFEAKVVDSETGAVVPGYVLYTQEKPFLMARSDAEGRLVLEDLSPGVMTFMTGEGEGKEVPDCAACEGMKTYENIQYSRWWSPDVRKDEEGPWGQMEVPEGDKFQDNFNSIYFDMKLGMPPVTIFVEKSATISGRVTDPDGKPVEGATVAPARNGESLAGDTRFSVKTDKDGRYVMYLPASKNTKYNVLAHDGDYNSWRSWANGVTEPLQTTPGQTIENLDLQLTRPGSVKGRVRRNGKPVANYIVRTVACDQREHSYYNPAVRTKADGTFEIKFVRPGKHFLQVGYFQYPRKGDQGPVIEVTAGEAIEDQELEAKQQPDPDEGVVPEPTPAAAAPAGPQKEPTPVGQNDKTPKVSDVNTRGKEIMLPGKNGESQTVITGDVEIMLDLDKVVWWGEPVDGLEPGLWLTKTEDPRNLRVPMDSRVNFRVLVRNTTGKDIECLVRLLPFDGMDVPYLIPSSELDAKGKIVTPQPAKQYQAQGAANVLKGINPAYIITLAAGESALVPGEYGLYVGKTDVVSYPQISDFVPGTHWIVQPLLVHPLADKERAELNRQLGEFQVTKIDRDGKTRRAPVVRVGAPDNSKGKLAYAKYHLEVGTLDASAHRNAKTAIWGEVEQGMQCGIRLLNPQPSYQIGDTLEAELLWRNTSDAVISTSRPQQLDFCPSIEDAEGKHLQIDFGARIDLLPPGHDFQPGEVRSLGVTKVTLVAQGTPSPKDNKEPGHITLEPGKYKLSANGGVGNISPNSGKYEFTVDASKAVEPLALGATSPPMRQSVIPPKAITGQIVNEKNVGIAGADVALVVEEIVQGRLDSRGRVVATTVADPLGNYSLAIPREVAEKKSFGAIWAKAEGYVAARSHWSSVIPALSERKAALTLTATAGTQLQVLDPTGKPLAGVRVVPTSVGIPKGVGYSLPKEWEDQSSSTTDSHGDAHLPHVDPEALKGLDLVPPGDMGLLRYDQNYFLNNRPQKEGDSHFGLQLPETGSVTGQLVLSPGSTLPKDLKITLESYIKPFSLTQAVVTVPVDADGKFHVDKLAAGWLYVPEFLPADQPLRADVDGRIEVKANEELHLRIPVAPGVRVHGQVRKSDTQAGIPKYPVTVIYGQAVSNLNPGFRWLKFDVETDADGRFECLVPPGPINVNTSRYVDGYSSAFSWLPKEERGHWGGMRFVVPAEESFDLGTIELTRNVEIQGQVVNLKNEPLVDWSVFGYPNIPGFTQSGTMNSMPGVHTDKEGNFSGSYRQTYPPAYWKVSQRVWKTKYEFDDHKYAAKVISHQPLVLQVDTTKELSGGGDEVIPLDPEAPTSPAKPPQAAVQIPQVRPNGPVAPALNSDVIADTKRDLLQRLVRGGKISTDSLNAMVTLVSSEGANDREFIAVVLAEFDKSCEAMPGYQSQRNLMAVLTKMLAIHGATRWQESEAGPEDPLTQADRPAPLVLSQLSSEILNRLITQGRKADRSNIDAFVMALRQAHHADGKEFMRDVLRNPEGNDDPYEAPTTQAPPTPPKGQWADNIGGSWRDAKFHAAVGLAELGDSEGVERLIEFARPNENGLDESVFQLAHTRDTSGSRRASSHFALIDLFGLNREADFAELEAWWQANRESFHARPVNLGRQPMSSPP